MCSVMGHLNLLGLLCVILVLPVDGRVRTWLHNTNVLNKENWLPDSNDCSGIIFPNYLGGKALLSSVNVSKIELPMDGELILDEGATIQFLEKDTKCIKIKQIQYRNWNAYKNWNSLKNNAIPHIERIPCDEDDVVFPKNSTFAISVVFGRVNSMWVGEKRQTVGSQITLGGEIKIIGELQEFNFEEEDLLATNDNNCMDSTDCVCHEEHFEEVLDSVCSNVNVEPAPCWAPIKPHGHCSEICGMQLLLHIDSHFERQRFKAKISSYDNIEYSLRRINPLGDFNIQLVVVDTEESGFNAIEVAKDLQKMLLEDKHSYHIISYKINVSGAAIRTNAIVEITFGIIFGTFLITLLFFTAIYVVYIGPLRYYQCQIRMPLHKRPHFRPFTFARFDNKNEGGMSFERSAASSVMSLEKSFSNPMYGREEEASSSKNFSQMEDEPSATELADEAAGLEGYDEIGLVPIQNISNENN